MKYKDKLSMKIHIIWIYDFLFNNIYVKKLIVHYIDIIYNMIQVI